MRLQAGLICAFVFGSTGCGVIYTVPKVSEGKNAPFYQTDLDVQVVPLTYETAAAANLEPYIPPRLPTAFQPNAAESVRLASYGTARPLPAPTARRATRPDPVVDRIPPQIDPGPYRIGMGDVLLISVSSEGTTIAGLPALIASQSKREGYTVQDDGAIAVPDVGRIGVAGMTLKDAEEAIFKALVAAGVRPAFTLEVAEFNSRRVSIGGMVGSPSLVPITLQPLSLEVALNIAGGVVAQDPEVTKIQIFRGGEIYQIGLQTYLSNPGLGKLLLLDGDSIYVGFPPDLAGEAERYFQEQLLLRGQELAEIDRRKAIEDEIEAKLARDRALFNERLELGAVQRPYAFIAGELGNAEVELPFEGYMSLSNVLLGGGGRLNLATADYAKIYVLRRSTDPARVGGVTAYHLDAENAANLVVAADFRMRPNDLVFVSSQLVTDWNRALSQLTPSFFLQFPSQVAAF
ncbi:polysaccharide biosynthesis/export family protein [Thermohalobaculum sediminis]|uniref:polysaccharide biosynthesis/export family protein n=1 Tax=Thermohalobaculum sediminis TaxID=2939436 RepID=UPI0020BE0438|nr:polysaccharide biosynthesis/export family protein [Limibaculum sediminis]